MLIFHKFFCITKFDQEKVETLIKSFDEKNIYQIKN